MPTQIETRMHLAAALQRLADRVTRGEFGPDGLGRDKDGNFADEVAWNAFVECEAIEKRATP